jgi:glycosyl transferase family 2
MERSSARRTDYRLSSRRSERASFTRETLCKGDRGGQRETSERQEAPQQRLAPSTASATLVAESPCGLARGLKQCVETAEIPSGGARRVGVKNWRRWIARIPILCEFVDVADARLRRLGELADRPRRAEAQLLSLLTVVTGSLYLLWIRDALNPAHPILGWLFWSSEAACLLLFAIASTTLWRLRFKPADSPPPDRVYSIDILVPVCGEPIEVIAKTLRAAAAVRWSGPIERYVLDDGGSAAVRAVAAETGFHYLSRQAEGVEKKDAKAGNLNFGLARSQGELVLVLDADQVPQPNILEALVGYMRFPRLAFVQSQQCYLVPDGDPFFNEDRVFYSAVQMAMDNHDTVIACGSGVLYRRAALDDIGGIVTWNLVEDLTTSYELHAHGWKSFYYPYPLSQGLAPDDIWGVAKQRGQWALDTMRLFWWDNPLFKRGLPWRKRLNYFLIGWTYLTVGFFIPFLFAIPPWVYLTGSSIIDRPELEFALVRGIYFFAMAGGMHYLAYREDAARQFQMLVGLFPVYLVNALRALYYRGTKPGYHVNNRRTVKKKRRSELAVLPQLALVTANLYLPFYAIWAGTAPARVIAVNALVSALAVWTLWRSVEAALGTPTWETARHPMQFYGLPESA